MSARDADFARALDVLRLIADSILDGLEQEPGESPWAPFVQDALYARERGNRDGVVQALVAAMESLVEFGDQGDVASGPDLDWLTQFAGVALGVAVVAAGVDRLLGNGTLAYESSAETGRTTVRQVVSPWPEAPA